VEEKRKRGRPKPQKERRSEKSLGKHENGATRSGCGAGVERIAKKE